MTKNSKEIPELFSAEELAIISMAQSSFSVFLTYIFPASFEGETWRMADGKRHPFSLGEIHYIWADIVEKNSRVCILAPRAHLKSTIINHAFSMWKLMSSGGKDVDGIVMSFKDKLAMEHTTKIKSFIKKNKYFRFWVDNKPTAESLVDFTASFDDGIEYHATVDPYGVLSTVRGLHPKFLILDDILADFSQNSIEPVQIKRIDQVFRQSLESLPDEGDSLVVIGTPQSYEDTLYKLRDNKQYVWARFPAEQKGKTLWPEKFDLPRLRRTEARIKSVAYQVEFLLVPFFAVNSFLPMEVVESCIDKELIPFDLDVPFDPKGTLGIYGGMDVGKEVHPSHISVGALMPSGDIVQIFQAFLDGMDYNSQAKFINRIIDHFGIRRFYYDNTRAEMDDRHLTRKAIGVTFTLKSKVALAIGLESRFFADEEEPGIILLDDRRQTGQIVSVDKTLKSIETVEGHGDCFWSLALMTKAADDGPVMQILGDAQDMFGGFGRRKLFSSTQ